MIGYMKRTHKFIATLLAFMMIFSSTVIPLKTSMVFASDENDEVDFSNSTIMNESASSPADSEPIDTVDEAGPIDKEQENIPAAESEDVSNTMPADKNTEIDTIIDKDGETSNDNDVESLVVENDEEPIVRKTEVASLYDDSTYVAPSFFNGQIKITGPMPESATVKAYEINNAITDMQKENIFAFAFEIFDKDGNVYDKDPSDIYEFEIVSSELMDIDHIYLYEKDEYDLRFTEKLDFSQQSSRLIFDSRANQFVISKDIETEEEQEIVDDEENSLLLSPNEESDQSEDDKIKTPDNFLNSLIEDNSTNPSQSPEENVKLDSKANEESDKISGYIDWRKDLLELSNNNEESDSESSDNQLDTLEEDLEDKQTTSQDEFDSKENNDQSDEETSKDAPDSEETEEASEDESEKVEESKEADLEEAKESSEDEEKLTYQQVLADIYTDSTYSTRADDLTRIKLSGDLPGYTKIKAYPVDIEIKGKEVLAAYDITIFDENDVEYKVTAKNNVEVEITNEKIQEADQVEVYHKENESAPEEKIEVDNKSHDTVTFKADSFSIYAVTDPKAQATRTYEFYVRNADGSLKLISTQTIRSGQSLQKPVIPILADRGRYAGWFPIGEDKVEHGSNEVHFFTPITFDTKTPVTIKAEPLFLDNAYIDFKERVYITEENKKDFEIPSNYTLSPDGYYRNSKGEKLYRDEVFKTRVQNFDKPIGEAHIPIIKEEDNGQVLSYWSINPEGGEQFDFKNTSITHDLIRKQEEITGEEQLGRLDLFAIYEDGFTISFDSQGGSHVTRQIVKKGESLNANKIIDPIKPGYVFKGWSLTPGGEIINLENRIITQSKTLYAIYDKLPGTYTVSHYTENINDTGFTFYNSETKVEQVGNYTKGGEYFRNPANSEIAKDLIERGYTAPKSVTPSDKAALVKADGSTNIKVYYRRPRYNLTVYSTGLFQGVPTRQFIAQYKEGEDTKDSWDRMGQILGRYVVREGSLDGPIKKVPGQMPAHDLSLYFLPTRGNEDWYTNYIEVDENDVPIRDENGNLKVIRKTTHNAIFAGLENYVGGDTVEGFEYRYVTKPGQNEDSPKVYTRGQPKEVRTFYKRLSYQLVFKTNNINYDDRIKTVPYETKIAPLVPTDIKIGDTDKNGATFKGWYDNPQLKGLPVEFTNLVMPAKDTTYFGKWEQQKHNIRIYREMTTPGQVSSPDKIINFQVNRGSMLKRDDEAWNPIKPAKLKDDPNTKLTWYRFSGTQFEEYKFDEPITEDLFLYPVWSYFDPVTQSYRPLEDIHTITYTDGTNSFTDKNLYLNNAAAILQAPYVLGSVDKLEDPENLNNTYFGNLKVPEGKHFQGWLLNNDPSRIYRPGEVVNVTSDMTFYPKWGEYDKTSINLYEQKPGTDKSKFSTEKMRENGTIKLPTPTTQNYVFEGWSKTPSGNVDFKGGQEVMVTNENLPNQLFGIWKANRTINIHEEQPLGTKNTYKKENVADGEFNIPTPNKIDGYTFMGWSTNPNDKTIAYKADEVINVSENNPLPTDIYGVWEKERLKLTATFNLQNVQRDKLKYTITITKPVALENDNTLLARFINTSFAAEMIDSGTTTVVLGNGESTTFPDIEPGSTIEITQETLPKVVTSYSVNGADPVEGNTATVTAGTENINVVFNNEDIPPSVRLHTNYGSINYDDLRDKDGNPITPGVDDKIVYRKIADGGNLTYRNLYKSVNELIPLGFSLKGWAESPDGPVQYNYHGNNPSYSEIGDKDLYAIWYNPVKIIVDLEVDDGEKVNLPITVNYSYGGYQESEEFNLSQSNSFEKIAPTNTNFDSVVFETPEYYTSQIVEHVEEETEDYYIIRRTIKLTRDTPPVPTGIIDNLAPMVTMLALAIMAFAFRIYNKTKTAGGIDE